MGVLYPHADKIPKKRGKREGKGEDFERKEQNVRGSGIMDCPCVKNLEFLEGPVSKIVTPSGHHDDGSKEVLSFAKFAA